MRSLLACAACVLSLIGAGQVHGQSAQYIAVDLSPAGFTNSCAFGVGNGQQVGYSYMPRNADLYYRYHAVLWSGNAASAVDLSPAGATQSAALAVDNGQQVGWSYSGTLGFGLLPEYFYHAMLWAGSAASGVDLHPAGFTGSQATAIGGGQQVGYGFTGTTTPGPYHALLWSGSAASVVDLHPAGWTSSVASGLGDGLQAGYVNHMGTPEYNHAMIWHGSAASAVDLNPSGCNGSEIFGAGDGQQVGDAYGAATDNRNHAFVWSGSAASAVDLNPSGFEWSCAYGVAAGRQAGYAEFESHDAGIYRITQHAMLWAGTAASAVDLHSFLGVGYVESRATAIDDGGNVAGYAWDAAGHTHAIAWVAVPEPASVALLALGALLVARRRV